MTSTCISAISYRVLPPPLTDLHVHLARGVSGSLDGSPSFDREISEWVLAESAGHESRHLGFLAHRAELLLLKVGRGHSSAGI